MHDQNRAHNPEVKDVSPEEQRETDRKVIARLLGKLLAKTWLKGETKNFSKPLNNSLKPQE